MNSRQLFAVLTVMLLGTAIPVHATDLVSDSDTFFELGGDYHFNSQFSAGATLEFGGDADSLTIGARWFFGQ